MKKKLRLKKEVKEDLKAILYTIVIIFGIIAFIILIGIVENAKF